MDQQNIWIHVDGQRQGPLTIDDIRAMGIDPETPVWYQGLVDWTPARLAPRTAELFTQAVPRTDVNDNAEVAEEVTENVPYVEQPAQVNQAYSQQPFQQYQPQFATQPQQQPRPQKPASYLVWSILVTLCCCVPCGLVSIFYGAKVSNLYNTGQYERAAHASEVAAWWLIIGFVLGLMAMPFTFMLGL